MFRPRNNQRSFFDAEHIREGLINKDRFYRKFREVIRSLIDDADFASVYCRDNARPPISSAIAAETMIEAGTVGWRHVITVFFRGRPEPANP